MRVLMGSSEFAALAAESVADNAPVYGFREIGHGATRAALLGPDGVVYKASRDGGTAFLAERLVFETLARAGAPCCPDFWPYDDLHVMAMRRYRAVGPTDLDIAWQVHRFVYGDVAAENCGVADDGRIVLLDGGSALLVPG